MDLPIIARRIALDPMRKSILTTRTRMDSTAPGPSRLRHLSELIQYLESDIEHAVLIWSNIDWIAIYRNKSSPRYYIVSRLPTKDIDNKLGDKIKTADDAIDAALQI
jgi:hypothetical protein